MTEETFKKYENLQKRFYKVTAELFFLNEVQSSNPNKKIRDDGWLELTYGNGSKHNCILSNKLHMLSVCDLIESLLTKELEEIKKMMDEL